MRECGHVEKKESYLTTFRLDCGWQILVKALQVGKTTLRRKDHLWMTIYTFDSNGVFLGGGWDLKFDFSPNNSEQQDN